MMPKVTGSVRKIGSTVASLPGKIVSPIGKIGKAVAGKFPGITSAFSDFTGYLGAWGGNVGSALSGVLGNVGKFMPGFAKLMNFGLVAGVSCSWAWIAQYAVWRADQYHLNDYAA